MAEIIFTEATSVSKILDTLLETAYNSNASDIHIDPLEHNVIVKFRIDGDLHTSTNLNKNIHAALISKVKILSKLRTDEHSVSQDGRFRKNISDDFVDVRVSIMPTYYGENIVLRLLKNTIASLRISDLGLSNNDQSKINHALSKPTGMILTTGPTGSGKTTTLYTLLKQINIGTKSIITLEDPIEYAISGIRQVQMNPQRNFSFAQGLRSIVRQDPDIIMVGEIRDQETVKISIQIALTGHKLLSTIHTNDALATITRIADMGVEPYLIASTLDLVIAQRLVRKLCTSCKNKTLTSTYEKNIFEAHTISVSQDTCIYTAVGCESCRNTGYSGRIGIYEILVITPDIRDYLVSNKISISHFKKIAENSGFKDFYKDSLQKVLNGITSIQEIFRVLYE